MPDRVAAVARNRTKRHPCSVRPISIFNLLPALQACYGIFEGIQGGQAMKSNVVERHVSVKTVDGSLIQGKINIGTLRRISDMFQESGSPFVIVYEARSKLGENKVFIVNKSHIVWVEPDDDNIVE